MIGELKRQSSEKAAASGEVCGLGHAGLAGSSLDHPQGLGAEERAVIMFSGKTGAVVASGEVLAVSEPTCGLVDEVSRAIDAIPTSPMFDKHAKSRPCGLLDRYSAKGMLLGDLLGLPEVMPWVFAEKIGKAIPALLATMRRDIKKQRAEARRAAQTGQGERGS